MSTTKSSLCIAKSATMRSLQIMITRASSKRQKETALRTIGGNSEKIFRTQQLMSRIGGEIKGLLLSLWLHRTVKSSMITTKYASLRPQRHSSKTNRLLSRSNSTMLLICRSLRASSNLSRPSSQPFNTSKLLSSETFSLLSTQRSLRYR